MQLPIRALLYISLGFFIGFVSNSGKVWNSESESLQILAKSYFTSKSKFKSDSGSDPTDADSNADADEELTTGEIRSGHEKSFKELGIWSKTDKISGHHYECAYEESLAPYRHVNGVKLLEIGLGCGMRYGVGASYKLWARYFSNAQIYILEYKKDCGQKWMNELKKKQGAKTGTGTGSRLPIMLYGDKSDRQFLKKVVAEHGPWDIIVDDGGHRAEMQIIGFEELFPALSPGGTYFIEDLHFNADTGKMYRGTKSGLSEGNKRTAVSMISEIYAASLTKKGLGANLSHLKCCSHICAFKTSPLNSKSKVKSRKFRRIKVQKKSE